jgi:hypothetical protein
VKPERAERGPMPVCDCIVASRNPLLLHVASDQGENPTECSNFSADLEDFMIGPHDWLRGENGRYYFIGVRVWEVQPVRETQLEKRILLG